MFVSGVRRSTVLLGVATIALLGTVVSALAGDVVIATAPTGRNPTAIAVNTVSDRVYVTNYFGNSISIIDGVTHSSIASLPVGTNTQIPIAIVVDPLLTPARAYAVNFWSGTMTVIDESSLTITQTVTLGGGHGSASPRALALDAGAATPALYVAEYGLGIVRVLDPATYATVREIPVGDTPRALGIFSSIPRTRIYVANGGSASVSIIDGASGSVVATVPTGVKPRAIAVDPATGWAWVTSETSNTVTVIDDTDALRATIPVGAAPKGIAIDSAGGRVFVANSGSGTVSVLRTATLDSEATLTVGTTPFAVAFDSGDRKAFVTCYGSDEVAVIDSTLTVTPVAVGDGPQSVAVNQTLVPHEAYVSNYLAHTLSVVDEPLVAPGSVAKLGPAGLGLAGLQVATTSLPVTVSVTSSARDKVSGQTTVTGTVSSTRLYPAAIISLRARLDGVGPWFPVQNVSGLGSASATWTIGLGVIASGTHTLEFDVLDQTSAVAQSADSGINGGCVDSAGVASASFTVAAASKPPRVRRGPPGTCPIGPRGKQPVRRLLR